MSTTKSIGSALLLMACLTTSVTAQSNKGAPSPPDTAPQNFLEFFSPSIVSRRVSKEAQDFNDYVLRSRYAGTFMDTIEQARNVIQEKNFEIPSDGFVFEREITDHWPTYAYYCDDTILTWFKDENIWGFRTDDQRQLLVGLRQHANPAYTFTKVGTWDLVRRDSTTISPSCADKIPDKRAVYITPLKKPEEDTNFYTQTKYERRDSCPVGHFGSQRFKRDYNYFTGTGKIEFIEDWSLETDNCTPWQERKQLKNQQYMIKKIIAGKEVDWECTDFYERKGIYKGFKVKINWGPWEFVSSTCDGVENRPPLELDDHDRKDDYLRTEIEPHNTVCPTPYTGDLQYKREVKYYSSLNPNGSKENDLAKYGEWYVTILDCTRQETRSLGCPAGWTGSVTQARTVTLTDLTGANIKSNWATTNNSCRQPIVCRMVEVNQGEESRFRCECTQGGRPVRNPGQSCSSSGGGGSGRDDDRGGVDRDGDGVDGPQDPDDGDADNTGGAGDGGGNW